jgi:hypothetical protein
MGNPLAVGISLVWGVGPAGGRTSSPGTPLCWDRLSHESLPVESEPDLLRDVKRPGQPADRMDRGDLQSPGPAHVGEGSPPTGSGASAALAAGPAYQLKIGGDPVERLPAAMPKTISAVDQLLRSACPPDTRRQTGDLMMTLAAMECHASLGGSAVMLPALLRDLVIITAKLAGRTWLEANADLTAAFTALQVTLEPPPLPELDQILARVLADRFHLPSQPEQPKPY